jgi:hypothetical protein
VYWLYKSIGLTFLHLTVSQFMLVLARTESDCLLLVTFLLNGILNCIFFKSSVLIVMTWPNSRLLSLGRTAGINMSFSMLLFSKDYLRFVLSRT